MWTHVYDESALENPTLAGRLSAPREAVYEGFHHRLHRQDYGLDRRLIGFSGGTSPYSNWLSRHDLLAALEHFGWTQIELAFEESHQNGPSLALVAVRDESPDRRPPDEAP